MIIKVAGIGLDHVGDTHQRKLSDDFNAARFGMARLGPVRFKESRIDSKSRFSGES